MSPPSVERVPWKTIAIWLAIAALVAWVVGFLAGLIVQFWPRGVRL